MRAGGSVHHSVSQLLAFQSRPRGQARFHHLLGYRPAACPSRQSIRCRRCKPDRTGRGIPGGRHLLHAQRSLGFAAGSAFGLRWPTGRGPSLVAAYARPPYRIGAHVMEGLWPVRHPPRLDWILFPARALLRNPGPDVNFPAAWVGPVSAPAQIAPLRGRRRALVLHLETASVPAVCACAFGLDRCLAQLSNSAGQPDGLRGGRGRYFVHRPRGLEPVCVLHAHIGRHA